MFTSLKSKLWELLNTKEISLAMLYNDKGDIVWHRGREIIGKTIQDGTGFSKSYIEKTLESEMSVDQENVIVTFRDVKDSRSASVLKIKSLLIFPIGDRFFLYLDSGTNESFNEIDRRIFKIIGELLGEMIQQVKRSGQDIGGVSGQSKKTDKVRDLILHYSLEEAPVMLLGETGVGKSHVAELIHRYSGRKGRFITVNTPSIPDNLFESEIFGHKKGAFTDARSDKQGFVDLASGGTIFFDEIAEIPLHFQAKFLRFIESQYYNILGDPEERKADVRIVAATNQDLKEAIEKKQFRQDLFFRLQVLEIEIPPLRERPEDIRDLVRENMNLLKGKTPGEGFWRTIISHDWPGNIRELFTVLTRAGIHCPDPITGPALREVMTQSLMAKNGDLQKEMLSAVYHDIASGKDFWQSVWQPFLKRDLNRREVRRLLRDLYVENDFSLKKLSQNLAVEARDFKKFIATLHKYDIHPAKEYK